MTSRYLPILRFAVTLLFTLAALGCGDDSTPTAGAGGMGATGGMSGSAGMELHPPATIDLNSCSHILRANVTNGSSCSTCCDAAGFDNAAFPFNKGCGCGVRSPHDTEICADQSGSRDSCTTCCNDASYRYGVLTNGTPCECAIPEDPAICASSTETEDVCTTCCLNNGFLGHATGGNPCVCSS